MNQIFDADVVVAGGGPAGIGAAIAATRAGAKTLLLEGCAFFGGVAAWGLGMPINQMRPGGEARGAVHERVIEGLLAYGDEAVRVVGHALVCNVEFLKVAVMDVLDDIGCNYLVHSRVADAVVENDRITGVVVAGKDGLVKINAKAAAMSVKKDCTPRQLDVKELQNALADDGVDYAKRRPQ
jgi:flavin-dependent dehydrogenase